MARKKPPRLLEQRLAASAGRAALGLKAEAAAIKLPSPNSKEARHAV